MVAHATLNGILRAEASSPDPATKDSQNMLTCSACPTQSNALLKTPHGWVCPNCFKLIYVPATPKPTNINNAAQPAIQHRLPGQLPYNTIDSYELDAYLVGS